MSSTVRPFGILTVLEIAPLMNGWAAPIIFKCAMYLNAAFALVRLERAIEHRQMLRLSNRCAIVVRRSFLDVFDRVVLLDVRDDALRSPRGL